MADQGFGSNDVGIVTGGTGGLGEATVRRLHAEGLRVIVADVADDWGKSLADELGPRAVFVHTDVTDSDSVGGAIEQAKSLGTLRYCVVAHGGFGGRPERTVNRNGSPASLDSFKSMIDIYLTGTYNVVRLVAAAIARGRAGCRRRTRSTGDDRVDRRLRGSDRSGSVLRGQGGDHRPDPCDRA